MSVSTTHYQYDSIDNDWQTLRDAFAGSTNIRNGAERYLPRPGGMKGTVDRDKVWQAYLARPEWLNATRRTVIGLTGCVFRKEPAIAGLDSMPNILQTDITGTGINLQGMLQQAFRDTLLMGRFGLLVDLPSQPQAFPEPVWSGYGAEEILNWRTTQIRGRSVLSLVVLREEHEEASSEDAVFIGDTVFQFNTNRYTRYRVLSLDEFGHYRVDIWRAMGDDAEPEHIETLFPQRRGEFLDFIPFIFLGPQDLEPSIEQSPVWDLIRINLRHWRHSADYEHGLHYTALPTPWITGHNPEFDQTDHQDKTPPQMVLGSGEAIVLPEIEAKIGLLTLSDSEFGALRRALDEDKNEMATLGARLLEERPEVNETATAVRLRQRGDESILRTLANTVSRGATIALRWDAWWRGATGEPDDEKIAVSLNTDFLSLRLTHQETIALMQLQQGGAISAETLYWNLEQGEVAQPGVSFELEQARIEANPPLMMRFDTFGPRDRVG